MPNLFKTKNAAAPTKKKEDFASLLWTLALIFFVRVYIVEPFKIPSGSMIPTLLVGDHLFVAKSSYDIGVPFSNKKLATVSEPKRGDVVVFEYPNHEHNPDKDGIYYIKRLIGLPGDEISVSGGIPTINGKILPQVSLPKSGPTDKQTPGFEFNTSHQLLTEKLAEGKPPHWVQRYPLQLRALPAALESLRVATGKACIKIGAFIDGDLPDLSSIFLNEICSFKVPEGQYFFMGDNRDDSADGRQWGFADRKLLKGHALFVWMSIKDWYRVPIPGTSFRLPIFPIFRWNRMGLGIN